MGYTLILTGAFKKSLKKVRKDFAPKIIEEVRSLSDNPTRGEALKRGLSKFRSLHLSFKGVQYRVAYQVFDDKEEVILIMVKSRENFYKSLTETVKM